MNFSAKFGIGFVKFRDFNRTLLEKYRQNPNIKMPEVGVYLGNNKFAHASLRAGVIVSDLDEPYYKKYFVAGGRLKIF